MTDPTLVLLRDARSLLADHALCKRHFAQRANGSPCEANDPRAVSYCALGALYAVAGVQTVESYHVLEEQEIVGLDDALADLQSVIHSAIAPWNNRWFRTKRGVLRAFDKAIAYREAEAVPSLSSGLRATDKVD